MKENFSCIICGCKNLQSILAGRGDREYGVPIKLHYFQCKNSHCFHVQTLPMPCESMIASFYAEYTTHNVYRPRGLARILDIHSEHKAIKRLKFLVDDFVNIKNIQILDFGCGNGANLKRLSGLGCKNLMGFDFDPKAISFVLSQGILCSGDFSELTQNSYDVIFVNHVIEHLPDPEITIRKLSTLLSPGGTMVIRTPNSRSLLARLCRFNWRGWETPRHLNIFSFQSLRMMIDANPSLSVTEACTSNDMLVAIAISSLPPLLCKIKAVKIISAIVLIVAGKIMGLISLRLGEEIIFKLKLK